MCDSTYDMKKNEFPYPPVFTEEYIAERIALRNEFINALFLPADCMKQDIPR